MSYIYGVTSSYATTEEGQTATSVPHHTNVVPIPEIAEEKQEEAVLVQPDSNKATDDAQQQVTEPEVEGGIVP